MQETPWLTAHWLAFFLLPLVSLLALYHATAFLGGHDDHRDYKSGIFDMDVDRVVGDWTSFAGGRRTNIHPLYKILIAPVGMAINRTAFGGKNPLAAVRVITIAGMTVTAALAGLLAFQLTGGNVVAGWVATVFCGVSFSSVLLASIPEAASISGISTLLPLVYLNARRGKRFSWMEATAWGLIAVASFAITISQIVHWAIALGARLFELRRRRASAMELQGGSRIGAKLALAAFIFIALVAAEVGLQQHYSPQSQPFYDLQLLSEEKLYVRTDDIIHRPLFHTARLAAHFFLYNFIAPFPAYSDVLKRMYQLDYYSLSLEEQSFLGWTAPQAVLVLAFILAVYPAALRGGRPGPLLIAPLLSIASQFLLHFLYGREYIMYSSNWHGVVVAVIVARLWPRLAARRFLSGVVMSLLTLGILLNSLAVMRRVYEEFHDGLEMNRRDASGAPLQPAEAPRERP